MYHAHPIAILARKWTTLLLAGILTAMFAAFVSLLIPLQYRADAGVYIISKSRYGVDPYTVVKSAEQVGQNMVQVIKTQDFFDKVMARAGESLDTSAFQNVNDRTRAKRWEKSVDGSVVFGTGVLNISAYNHDPAEAKLLAAAVVDTLVSEGYEYVGGDVTIKQVNKPIVTRFPVRPNVPLNAAIGFLLGAVLSATVIVLKNKSPF